MTSKVDFSRLDAHTREVLGVIGREADKAGLRVYVVGGAVRDLMLGVSSLDVDVVLEGDACAFSRRIAGGLNAKSLVHERFGTATLVFDNAKASVDLVTARRETYAHPGALPDVVPSSLEDDLFRRDFTVNALAAVLNKDREGTVVDKVGGLNDFEAKKIRVMHDKSFVDDPTRVIRAFRYAARFGFMIEPDTLRWMKEAVKGGALSTVTPVRYWNELKRVLEERDPLKALNGLLHMKALKYVCADDAARQMMRRAMDTKAADAVPEPWVLYLTILCKGCPGVEELLMAFGLPKDVKRKVCEALQFDTVLDMLIRDSSGVDLGKYSLEVLSFFYLNADEPEVKACLKAAIVDRRPALA